MLQCMASPRLVVFLLVAVTLSPFVSATEGRAAPQCAEFDLSDVISSGQGIAVDPGACLIVDIGIRSHEVTLAIDYEVMDDAMDVLMFDQNGIQTYVNGQNYRNSVNSEASFESMVGSRWLDWAPPVSINPKNWFVVFDNSAHDGDGGLGDQGGMVARFKIQLAPASSEEYTLVHDTIIVEPNQVLNLGSFAVDAGTEISYWVHPISGNGDLFIQSDNQLGGDLIIADTNIDGFGLMDTTQINYTIPSYLDLKNLNLMIRTGFTPAHFSIKSWFNPVLSPIISDYVNGTTTVGERIMLDARNTPNSLQQLKSLSWDYDSDMVVDATGDFVEAFWVTPGIKNVSLTVESHTGATIQKIHQITVEDITNPNAVISATGGILVDNYRILMLETEMILSSDTSNDDHMVESVSWKINGTVVSTNSDYKFNRSEIGYYNVVLEVTDPTGNVGLDNLIIKVNDDSVPELDVGDIQDVRSVEQGEDITLTVNAIDSVSSMDSLTITWDFDLNDDSDGDGDPSNDIDFTGSNLTTSFSRLGENKFAVTVTDPSGNSEKEILSIEVVEKPTDNGVFSIVAVVFAVFVLASGVVLFGYRNIHRKHAIELLVQSGLTRDEASARIVSISQTRKLPMFAKAKQIAGIEDNANTKTEAELEDEARKAEFQSIYGDDQKSVDQYAGFRPQTTYRAVDSALAEAALAAFAEEPKLQPVAASAPVSGKVRSGGIVLPTASTVKTIKLTTDCNLCGDMFSVSLEPSQKSALVSCPTCGADQLFER